MQNDVLLVLKSRKTVKKSVKNVKIRNISGLRAAQNVATPVASVVPQKTESELGN